MLQLCCNWVALAFLPAAAAFSYLVDRVEFSDWLLRELVEHLRLESAALEFFAFAARFSRIHVSYSSVLAGSFTEWRLLKLFLFLWVAFALYLGFQGFIAFDQSLGYQFGVTRSRDSPLPEVCEAISLLGFR